MQKKVRYAVVGLGNIAQVAMLPAFKNSRNSELVAFVSHDPVKLRELSQKYGVAECYTYESYEELLSSGKIDAVYIALPNSMHQEFAVRAAYHGIHVLCEKPMALTERACESMITACDQHDVKLMIAYRLHFERANMKAVEIAQSGELGILRLFNSTFTMQVRDQDNIRLQRKLGGGTLLDIGIYCINAARYLFRSEPLEVMAMSANNGEKRFGEIDEMTSAIMKFPEDRLATFTCSFGAADSAYYELVGTKGSLCVDSAYEYSERITHELTVGGKAKIHEYPKRDQFGPELTYFSDCILHDRKPEPSGEEGLADVRIINALYKSSQSGKAVSIEPVRRTMRPDLSMVMRRPPVQKPSTVHTTSPRGH